MRTLEALFANTTYQIQGDAEKNFQYAMYIIMELLGEYVQAERSTSNGRIDLLLQTKDYTYIVELKIDNTADAALQPLETGAAYSLLKFVRRTSLFAHQIHFFASWCAERAFLRTVAGINDLQRLRQSAAPSSMERLAPRFAFAECDFPDLIDEAEYRGWGG